MLQIGVSGVYEQGNPQGSAGSSDLPAPEPSFAFPPAVCRKTSRISSSVLSVSLQELPVSGFLLPLLVLVAQQ